MTDTVTEAVVQKAAEAVASISECGKLDGCTPAVCECREFARAALEAALPLIVAGERARCLRIAGEHLARVVATGYDPNSDEELEDRVAYGYGNAAFNISAAIRADKGGDPDGPG